VPANEVLDFSLLYGQNCSGCHGAGKRNLGPAPPLNDPLFRAIIPAEELQMVIAQGRERTPMPAFAQDNGGPLTPLQIQVLVKQIKGVPYKIVDKGERGKAIVDDSGGIPPQWGAPPQPPNEVPSYLAGKGRSGDLAGDEQRGIKVFAQACTVCHGEDGRGVARGNETVRTIHDPVFLALISNQALRRYVITGRPDLHMPSFNEARPADPNFKALTSQDVADLVALVASWRR
jgi:mono/diheme cytochrome c family protein